MNIQFDFLKNIKTKNVKYILDSMLDIDNVASAVPDRRLVAVWDDSDIDDDDGEVLDYKFGFLQSVSYDGKSLVFEVLRVNSALGTSNCMNYNHAATIKECRCPEVFCSSGGCSDMGKVVGAHMDGDRLVCKIRLESKYTYLTDDEIVETSKIELGLDKSKKQEAVNG